MLPDGVLETQNFRYGSHLSAFIFQSCDSMQNLLRVQYPANFLIRRGMCKDRGK